MKKKRKVSHGVTQMASVSSPAHLWNHTVCSGGTQRTHNNYI